MYTWQLPQHLLALVMLGIFTEEKIVNTIDDVKIIEAPQMSGAISLGNYIIASEYSAMNPTTQRHEYGHSRLALSTGDRITKPTKCNFRFY